MKSKTNCEEYKDWKSKKQWYNDGYVIINENDYVELWVNCYHNNKLLYYAPVNVRPMTVDELNEKQKQDELKREEQKQRNREYSRRSRNKKKAEDAAWEKRRQEIYEEEIRKEQENQALNLAKQKCFANAVDETVPEHYMITLDTETTGIDAESEEILQVSIIDDLGNTLYNKYLKPMFLTSWERAQSIHGITPDTVANAPTMLDEIKTITTILNSAQYILGYNVDFDIKFLETYGYKCKSNIIDLMPKFSEIYGEFNEYFGDYKWQKLSTCADYYGYDWGDTKAHDSLADCQATLYCYLKMVEGNNSDYK